MNGRKRKETNRDRDGLGRLRPGRPGAGRAEPPAPGRRLMLHRALSKLGAGSRGQAAGWIAAGRVQVDGAVVRDAFRWVNLQENRIRLDGRLLSAARPRVYLLLHKPAGFVTTRSDERGRATVYDLVPGIRSWIFPVGRLDRDSEGLLLLTDDGLLAERLTHPRHGVEKTYRVLVDRPLEAADLRRLEEGVALGRLRTAPAQVRADAAPPVPQEGPWIEITLREGKNRQVRRMLAALGYAVSRLVRIRVGCLELGGLPPGGWRKLTAAELGRLRSLSGMPP